MNFSGINDQARPDHLLHVGPITDEEQALERHRARLTVAEAHLDDHHAMVRVLQALGLIDDMWRRI